MRQLGPALVGSIALVVYAMTLMPGLAFGDWGEMQTIPHVKGIAHPTGYPTYILASSVAQLVPIGSIAFRANLFSAVLVASSVAVTFAILVRIGTRRLVAAAAALAFGAVPTIWNAATVAEVNALHLVFVTLILHRALAWEEHRRPRDLWIGALLAGLAFGNHLLIAFVVPLVALFVLWVGRLAIAARPSILAGAAAAVLVGLTTYVYIPLAAAQSPPLAYNHPVTLDGVLWLVSGTQFRGQFGFLTASGVTDFAGSFGALWRTLSSQSTPVMPVLGLIGLAILIRRRRAFGLLCVAILVANLYFWSTYLRLDHYLLVPWLVIAIGAGVAIDAAASGLTAWASRRHGPLASHAGRLVGIAALGLVVGLAAMHWEAADRSADRTAETFVDEVLTALPPDAAILSEWDATTPLWHAHYVLGRRPDVLIVDDTNIVYDGWASRDQRVQELFCQRPVFMVRLKDRDLPSAGGVYRLEPFLTVRVAFGGPSAAVSREVFRVLPTDPPRCDD